MITLEEMWESLRQDPEIKATMEEAEKGYKLFKKIENLIVADLEAKLAESKSKLRVINSHLASSQLEYNQLKKEYDEQEKLLSQVLATNSRLQFDFDQFKQQLAEKDTEIYLLHTQLNLLRYDEAFKNLADDEEKADE